MTWLVEHADGMLTQHFDAPGDESDDPGVRCVELPRMIDFDLEAWDWDAAEIVTRPDGIAARVDHDYVTAHGPTAIEVAHIKKEIEAKLIVAGYVFDGLLSAEAAATGQAIADLANEVIAQSEPGTVAEVARIVAKREALGAEIVEL